MNRKLITKLRRRKRRIAGPQVARGCTCARAFRATTFLPCLQFTARDCGPRARWKPYFPLRGGGEFVAALRDFAASARPQPTGDASRPKGGPLGPPPNPVARLRGCLKLVESTRQLPVTILASGAKKPKP